ncbi:MAG: hypothetical protein COA79_24080 [Planctomycetota bacterium]|nr:MAG: hypothetical protein COA79_24080 [Planctomycetota bacterium]
MTEVKLKSTKPIFDYLKSLDDYIIVAEEDNTLILERNELEGVHICVVDQGVEIYVQVNLCKIEKVENKLSDLLNLNTEILPAAFGIDKDTDSVVLVGSIFAESLDENELVGLLMSICNGIDVFMERVLE